ncbi:MAG: hypothetical protein ABWZ42_08435 [Ilumatobacteraceae bacterium]
MSHHTTATAADGTSIGRVPGASVETWHDHGHGPHLVDPDRFVDRLLAFWAGSTGG